MNNKKRKQEIGSVEVEATFIFPIMFLCIFFLLYLSLIMYQRANLQATLETSLMYFKNTITDTFVEKTGKVEYRYAENSRIGVGNDYVVNQPLNPYRFTKMGTEDEFKTYFNSIAKNMLFNKDIDIDYKAKNGLLLKEIKVTAKQEIQLPIDFSIIGVDNKYVISATARMVAVDHEDTIRNIDFVIYIVEKTKLADIIQKVKDNTVMVYNKFTSALGMDS